MQPLHEIGAKEGEQNVAAAEEDGSDLDEDPEQAGQGDRRGADGLQSVQGHEERAPFVTHDAPGEGESLAPGSAPWISRGVVGHASRRRVSYSA